MSLKNEFALEFFRYLKNLDYTIFRSKNSYRTSFCAAQKALGNIFDSGNNFNSYSTVHSENEFLNILTKSQSREIELSYDDQARTFDFFVKFFNQSTVENQTLLLKDIEAITNSKWNKYIFKVLDGISKDNKELIQNIHAIPISTMDISSVSLSDWKNYLSSKQIDDQELDKFFLKYLRIRKNQIKDSYTGPQVKQFLLDHYGRNREKLEPYFLFFNHIKDEFEEISLDIEEMTSSYTTTTRLNCRKASQLLCIPKYTESEIKKEIESFCYGMMKYQNFDQVIVDEFDKPKNIVEVRIYSSFPFEQKELNSLIKDYLLFKKSNPTIETNKNTVEKWLMQKSLKEELSSKESTPNKRVKI